MANYKEMITGTLNSLAGKAKQAAENSPTFNNVVGKVKDAANTANLGGVVEKVKDAANSSPVRGIYDKGTGRAKAYAQVAKLTLEMNGENEELKKVFCEIGRLYYEQAKEAPEGYFAPLFEQAEALSSSIEAKQAEIAELKESVAEDSSDIEVEIADFEEVVAADEAENAVAEEAPVEEAPVEEAPADVEVEIFEEPANED